MERRWIEGAAAGMAGTAALSATILAGKAVGRIPLSAPHEISWRLHAKTGLPHRPIWLLGHYGYGAAAGLLFQAIRRLLPRSPLVAGAGYGLAVWAASYLWLMPRLGLYPKAARDWPHRRRVMIAGHAVYGLVLALLSPRR